MADIFVARQPMYDRELEVFAYELSFGEQAASSTEVVNAYLLVLSSLPLSDEIEDAPRRRAGPRGVVLSAVRGYERARFEDLRALAPPGMSAQEIYQWAITWAREASVELEAASAVTA